METVGVCAFLHPFFNYASFPRTGLNHSPETLVFPADNRLQSHVSYLESAGIVLTEVVYSSLVAEVKV